MKINFTEENKEIFEHEIIPLFSISEFWNDYSPSLWYRVFEVNGSLRAIAFTELHDRFDIEKITDSSYGIVNVQNKTLDFNDDCDYAFYIHEQKPTNIFGFFSHFSQASLPSLYVTKETFFENRVHRCNTRLGQSYRFAPKIKIHTKRDSQTSSAIISCISSNIKAPTNMVGAFVLHLTPHISTLSILF